MVVKAVGRDLDGVSVGIITVLVLVMIMVVELLQNGCFGETVGGRTTRGSWRIVGLHDGDVGG